MLFFDGVAMLVPEYMADEASFDDYPIVSALKEHGLFTIVRPEKAVSATETERLRMALADIIETGLVSKICGYVEAPASRQVHDTERLPSPDRCEIRMPFW